jgi:hypothetical protein
MSEIQTAFEQFYPQYRNGYTPDFQQHKAAANIMACKTPAMGLNACTCTECGHMVVHNNSCRDRHCPSCQGITRAIWTDERSREVLDAPYFHVVFTVPHELHSLIRCNQTLLYKLMYQCVAKTLFKLCSNSSYLGAQPGFLSILHTWTQDLHYHPHIHTVVLAGGLSRTGKWQASSHKFFIPVKVLARVFRGKFMDYLKKYYRQNSLQFYGSAVDQQQPLGFKDLIDCCYAKDWYVYSKRTFEGPQAVVQYLGRYTHRIAISNQRILDVSEDAVTIRVRDRADANKTKTLTLSGVEFIRRFLMHVLPKGFVKIRYYGLLANRNKKTKLVLCRKLSGSRTYKPRFDGLTRSEIISLILGRDITVCPACGQSTLTRSVLLCKIASP